MLAAVLLTLAAAAYALQIYPFLGECVVCVIVRVGQRKYSGIQSKQQQSIHKLTIHSGQPSLKRTVLCSMIDADHPI